MITSLLLQLCLLGMIKASESPTDQLPITVINTSEQYSVEADDYADWIKIDTFDSDLELSKLVLSTRLEKSKESKESRSLIKYVLKSKWLNYLSSWGLASLILKVDPEISDKPQFSHIAGPQGCISIIEEYEPNVIIPSSVGIEWAVPSEAENSSCTTVAIKDGITSRATDGNSSNQLAEQPPAEQCMTIDNIQPAATNDNSADNTSTTTPTVVNDDNNNSNAVPTQPNYESANQEWRKLHNPDGSLNTSISNLKQLIQSGPLDVKLIPSALLLLTGVRLPHMSDEDFEKHQDDLQSIFLLTLHSSQPTLDPQIEVDIKRSLGDRSALRRLFRVFTADNHTNIPYIQGFVTLASVCLQLFPDHPTGTVYAVFDALLKQFWWKMYANDFALLTDLSELTMSTVREHDQGLHDAISQHLAGSPLAILLSPLYLLWLRGEVLVKHTVITKQHLHRIGSLWVYLLSYDDPNRAVAVMVAAMLLQQRAQAVQFCTDTGGSLLQLFGGGTEWEWSKLMY